MKPWLWRALHPAQAWGAMRYWDSMHRTPDVRRALAEHRRITSESGEHAVPMSRPDGSLWLRHGKQIHRIVPDDPEAVLREVEFRQYARRSGERVARNGNR